MAYRLILGSLRSVNRHMDDLVCGAPRLIKVWAYALLIMGWIKCRLCLLCVALQSLTCACSHAAQTSDHLLTTTTSTTTTMTLLP